VERHGAVHVDVDQVVHRMYDPGTPGFDRVVEAFGPTVIGEDGFINRRALGQMVFSSTERQLALRDAIGDYAEEVRKVIAGWRETLPHDQIAVFEAFNLVEGHYGRWCDVSWIVRTDDALALARILSRNPDLSEDDARARMAMARSWEIRIHACDLMIDNNGTIEEFDAAIDDALANVRQAYLEGTLPPSKGHADYEIPRREGRDRPR